MSNKFNVEMKVGVFVSAGVGLIMLAIIVLGGNDSLFSKTNHYHIFLPAADGLITGAKVTVAGLAVGSVQDLKMNGDRNQIDVTIQVEAQYGKLLREDSTAEIATMGVLGDKFVSLSAGSADKPVIPALGEIQTRPGKDISQFFGKSDQLLGSLNSVAGSLDRLLKTFESGNKSEIFFSGMANSAKNMTVVTERLSQQLDGAHLKGVLSSLHSILEKIDRGTGTVGAMINDPALYDDAKSLLGGANRNKIVRNLVRQTIKDDQEAASPKK